MKKRITINNHLINGPGNISPTPPSPPPVPITEDLLFIGRDGGITVYDVAKGQIVTEIENVGTPTDILINAGMNVIFVASELGLSVVDLTSYQLIAQTPVPAGGRFIHQIGYNPNNNTVYTGADFKVFGFDPDNNYQLSTTIDVPQTGGTGGRFTLNPLTSRGYVPISFVDNVYTLDLITNTLINTVNISPNAADSAGVNSTTNLIYILNNLTPNSANIITVIDGNSDTIVTTIPLAEPGNLSPDLGIDEVNNRIYISNLNFDNPTNILAYLVDGNTNTLLDTITIDRNVNTRSVAVNPTFRRAYISDFDNDIIYVIDTSTNTLIQELPFQGLVIASFTP